MSKFIDKRKRSREDDFLCESTPLSKRINNLHLTNFDETQQDESIQIIPNKSIFHNEITVQLPHKQEIHQSPGGSSSNNAICMGLEEHLYNPELSESQNPFYYVKNKLLHDLHLERMKRCTV